MFELFEPSLGASRNTSRRFEVWDTSLSPNNKNKKKYDSKFLSQKMKEAGFHTSLPAGLFNLKGDLLFANDRMQSLLGSGHKTFPILAPDLENLWPFSNEEKAGPALFSSSSVKRLKIRVHV